MNTASPDIETADHLSKRTPLVRIIEDDSDVRRSMVRLLSTIGLQAQAFPSAKQALAEIDPNRPGCLIIDMRLPDRDGLDLLKELAEKQIKTPAIIVTAFADVPSVIRAMKLKAFDFIEKPFPEQQFLAAVQKAVDRDIARHDAERDRRTSLQRIELLSHREREVLEGIVAGKSSKMIAFDMGISPKTVENYRANLMDKLEAQNVAHLVTLVYSYFNTD